MQDRDIICNYNVHNYVQVSVFMYSISHSTYSVY